MNDMENKSQDELKQEVPVSEEKCCDKKSKKKKDNKIDVEKTLENLVNTEKKLEETVKELESTKDTFQRTLAEYDNFRKRTAKEKQENFTTGKIEAVTSLLPIIDTLEIALASPCKDEEYKKGIEMVMTTAKNTLSTLGVEEIESVGKEFDPNIHAAVMQEESDEHESGIVTKQFQKGYKMGDKVIRPATVAVAQ